MTAFRLFLYVACLVGLASCSSDRRSIVISDFEPMFNYEFDGDTLVMEMELDAGPFRGIRLPSARRPVGKQTFQFAFMAKNTAKKASRVAYKIYYQNDTYRYPETTFDESGREIYNTLSAENFYGSWVSDSLEGFRQSAPIAANEQLLIQTELTIMGNPLNDRAYFAGNPIDSRFREIDIQEAITGLQLQPAWLASVRETTDSVNFDTLRVLRKAAIQSLLDRKSDYEENQRWMRNPRVGCYRFMLVAGDAESIAALPNAIKHMDTVDPEFKAKLNPFYFFKYGAGSINAMSSGITVLESRKVLKTYAVLKPSHGIFYNYFDFDSLPQAQSEFCASTDEMYMLAHFEQYVNRDQIPLEIGNIDQTADIGGKSYTLKQYLSDTKSNKRVLDYLYAPDDEPCEHIFYYPISETIGIQNPGNTEQPYRKQNAGIQGRVGFTYGKYRARIRFPEILSNQHVWNGLTCSFGLVAPDNPSEKEGNLASTLLEMSILKDSKIWMGSTIDTVGYHPEKDQNVVVETTLISGDRAAVMAAEELTAKGKDRTYEIYRAEPSGGLTIKTDRPAIESTGQIFYYEIEWKPQSISWKIGATIRDMKEVGYIDQSVSGLPNAQLVPLIRQEFQPTQNRPNAPFLQRHIAYPASPIQGLIYEIVIE